MIYFLVFFFATLSVLLILLLGFLSSLVPPDDLFFLARSRSFPRPVITPGAKAILAFFFANLLATRSASVDLRCLRSSFDKPASFSPSDGSPFGITTAAGACFLDFGVAVTGGFEPGNVLQRCTRSLRLANLSLVSSSAKSSSTHALSYMYNKMSYRPPYLASFS